MNSTIGTVAIVVFLLALTVASSWAFKNAADECGRRGGVLVKDYSGLPECVAGPSR